MRDRHIISPDPSDEANRRGKMNIVESKPIDVELEASMNSKDFFEPDDISMASAPHEISGPPMRNLRDELNLTSKAKNTATQFFKPKLFQNLEVNQRRMLA